jgi:iron(III) transport system ATP-binding protein
VTSGAVVRLSEVRIEDAGKRYGDAWAVRGVSLSIRPGELYTLLGPAGSGKTTLLRMLAGLESLDGGRMFVDDEPIDAVPPAKRNFGMVFPGGALWPHMSIADNVAFGLRARGLADDEVARRARSTLAQVGLEGFERRRPSELVDGQAQRAALARAIAVQPRLLLLDEPLRDLDPSLRIELRVAIARLQRQLGITTIYATRERAEALAVSTRIAALAQGRVLQEGRPEEMYWRPRNRGVAELVGAANLVPVRVVELREMGVVVETSGGTRLPVPSGGHTWELGDRGFLCLRPEALAVEESALAPGGIPGTVAAQVFEGSRQLYDVAIGGSTLRVETLTSALHGRAFKPGDAVKVEVAPETSVLLPEESIAP